MRPNVPFAVRDSDVREAFRLLFAEQVDDAAGLQREIFDAILRGADRARTGE